MKRYNKLVRDRVPDFIKAEGRVPKTRTLTARAFRKELLEKLVEEAREARVALRREDLVTELADVSEVLEAIMATEKILCGEVSKERRKRKKSRGSFTKRVFLESVQ